MTNSSPDHLSPSVGFRWQRHFRFPNQYKSEYSFPSGDTAQAGNFALFLFFFFSARWALCTILPGVAFARVFYVCHWWEDTLMGLVLGFLVQICLFMVVG